MMRFLHVVDIHFDSSLHSLGRGECVPVKEVCNATRRTFDHLIELAIDEEVSFVLLIGCLCNGDWKGYNPSLYFVKRIGMLQEANIRVFCQRV